MSDCGVCLYSSSDDWEGYIDDANIVTSECDQKCCECGDVVPTGSLIEEASWMDESEYEDAELDEDGEPIELPVKPKIYTCLICAEIADAFYCEGRVYCSGLWEALGEVYDQLSTSCFGRLKTPEAKAKLQREWMKWKGMTV
jgi:hypothetical protein